MRFEIVYRADYGYPEPVSDSLNALRVKPAVTSVQTIESFAIRVDPDARVHERRDYFGTDVLEFELDEPHDEMSIVAKADVLTEEPPAPVEAGWRATEDERYRRSAGEYLLIDAELHPPADAIEEMLGQVRAETPAATALAMTELIPDRFEYRQGTTFVGSTITDLIEGGAGVCQDFVHLGLLLLRRLGIGARYVSGYLFAAPPGGGHDSVEVQTHAWLEALLPPAQDGEPRWTAYDPTNRILAGQTHVKIGHGREYQDVPPIRGVYRGAAADRVEVAVEMRRVNGS